LNSRAAISVKATRAFTLLELMIVLVILGILMTLTIPTFSGMHKRNQLRSTAREIVALMKYARTEAVFGERMTEVFLDIDKRQYWLDLRTPDEKTGEYNPRAKKSQYEDKRDLHQDIWFSEVTGYDSNIISNKIIAVDFYPDGSASPTLFTLANKTENKMTIEVLKATGMTEISGGTIEEKKAKEEEERQAALGDMMSAGGATE
jgi:type II secretion system protein H